MFRSLKADHPQVRLFLCTATFCLVVVPQHNFIWACGFIPVYVVVCTFPLPVQIQLDGQREGTHNNINRDKATCPDKVVLRNNNKAKSSGAKRNNRP
jgi:hypothetical protein